MVINQVYLMKSEFLNDTNFLHNVNFKLEPLGNRPYFFMLGHKLSKIYIWMIKYNDFTIKPLLRNIYEPVKYVQVRYLDYYSLDDTNRITVAILSASNELNFITFSYSNQNPIEGEFLFYKNNTMIIKKHLRIQSMSKLYFSYFESNSFIIKSFEEKVFNENHKNYLSKIGVIENFSQLYLFSSANIGVNTFVVDSNKILMNKKCLFFSFVNNIFCKTKCSEKTEKLVDRLCENNCPMNKPYIDSKRDECISKCPKDLPFLAFGYCLSTCDIGIGNKVIKSCYCTDTTIKENLNASQGNATNTKNVTKCDVLCQKELKSNNPNLCRRCDENNNFIENMSCVKQCSLGWVFNQDKVCQKCPTNLTEGNVCVQTCQGNLKYIQGTKCVGQCSKNFTLNEDSGSCECKAKMEKESCVNDCSIGYGLKNSTIISINSASSKKCLKCGLDESTEDEKCVWTCSEGSIYNKDKVCSKCPKDKLVLNNECVEKCNEGFIPYKDKVCKKCKHYLQNDKCVDECEKGWIKDLEKRICLKCKDYEFTQLNKCVMSCKENWAHDKNRICYPCGKGKILKNNKCTCEKGTINAEGEYKLEKIKGLEPISNGDDRNNPNTEVNNINMIIILAVTLSILTISAVVIVVILYFKKLCCFKVTKKDEVVSDEADSPKKIIPTKEVMVVNKKAIEIHTTTKAGLKEQTQYNEENQPGEKNDENDENAENNESQIENSHQNINTINVAENVINRRLEISMDNPKKSSERNIVNKTFR